MVDPDQSISLSQIPSDGCYFPSHVINAVPCQSFGAMSDEAISVSNTLPTSEDINDLDMVLEGIRAAATLSFQPSNESTTFLKL